MTPSDPLRVIDLFAGAGGLTRGFLDLGHFRAVAAVENDLSAAATYAANFGADHTFYGAIEDYQTVPEADLVVGGPPCQGFSNLGKKDPSDSRNRLWQDFARVVVASGAEMFLFENVDRFSRTMEYQLLTAQTEPGGVLEDFTTQLYSLNAADFGTPQRRVRTIIVGSRIGPVVDPAHTHAREAGDLPSWRSVRDAIEGLALQPDDTRLPARADTFFGQRVAGPFKLHEIHVGRNYRPESLERYAYVHPGGNRFLLPDRLKYDCWRRHKTGAGDVLGRLEWDKPSVTIRTEFNKPEKGRYLHPEWSRDGVQVNRALTHAEAALLQGFDERHVWCGSKTDIARQIGNAVPPPLACAVAKVVLARLTQG